MSLTDHFTCYELTVSTVKPFVTCVRDSGVHCLRSRQLDATCSAAFECLTLAIGYQICHFPRGKDGCPARLGCETVRYVDVAVLTLQFQDSSRICYYEGRQRHALKSGFGDTVSLRCAAQTNTLLSSIHLETIHPVARFPFPSACSEVAQWSQDRRMIRAILAS